MSPPSRAYYLGDQWVDAADVQLCRANVDANVKRGLPLFYPVRKNLRRAEKALRNMSVAEIQSAIAIIRKHAAGTKRHSGPTAATPENTGLIALRSP